MTVAVKRWFLEKNGLNGLYEKKLTVVRETEKAYNVSYRINGRSYNSWIPKSVVIDEWEKDTSNFGYHSYLVNTYQNVYGTDNYVHQLTTKELTEALNKSGIEFLSRNDWNNR